MADEEFGVPAEVRLQLIRDRRIEEQRAQLDKVKYTVRIMPLDKKLYIRPIDYVPNPVPTTAEAAKARLKPNLVSMYGNRLLPSTPPAPPAARNTPTPNANAKLTVPQIVKNQ